MFRKTKDPTSGRLITLGREPLAQFEGKITAFEQLMGYSRHHFASFSDGTSDGVKGGARFSASACRIVVGMIKENISTGGRNLPVQWPDLSSEYEKEKEKYAGSKGQWRLKDVILNRVGVQKRRGEAGRSVGIYGTVKVPKISFGVMHGWPATKTMYPSQYAFWNEFGTDPTRYSGGQPPRPVFIPTFQQFARKYLPKLADGICASLEEDFERLKKNIDKPSGVFVGEAASWSGVGAKGLGAEVIYGEDMDWEDRYDKVQELVRKMSGADKWTEDEIADWLAGQGF